MLCHSLQYLFNRGWFSFSPLRESCDDLGVDRKNSVLQVVRRDNKSGYCNYCDPKKPVDQVVTNRPSKMLGSNNPNTEVRYLGEIDEEWQKRALLKPFEGEFDKVADLRQGN